MIKNFETNNLKIALIVTTGRTGSDYLNCCLDNLEGIMTFCGKFNYHQFFTNQDHKVNKKILINKFITKHKYLFSYNKEENINTKVDLKKFKNFFIKLSDDKINRKDFLITLYKAYHITLGRNFKNIKFLVHHSHGINETNRVLEDFPNSKLLITIRNPLANLKSGLSNWFRYDKKRISMDHVFVYIYRIRQDMLYLLRIKNKKFFVKLEEANLLKVKKKICKFLDIKFQKNIFKATLAGKVWRGDSLSSDRSKKGEYIKKVSDNNWKNYFLNKEILLLSLIYKEYQKFGYKLPSLKFRDKIKCYLSIFNLLSFERFVFKYNKNEANLNNIKYFLFIILYFLLIFLKLDFVIKNKHLS